MTRTSTLCSFSRLICVLLDFRSYLAGFQQRVRALVGRAEAMLLEEDQRRQQWQSMVEHLQTP